MCRDLQERESRESSERELPQEIPGSWRFSCTRSPSTHNLSALKVHDAAPPLLCLSPRVTFWLTRETPGKSAECTRGRGGERVGKDCRLCAFCARWPEGRSASSQKPGSFDPAAAGLPRAAVAGEGAVGAMRRRGGAMARRSTAAAAQPRRYLAIDRARAPSTNTDRQGNVVDYSLEYDRLRGALSRAIERIVAL